MSLILKLTIVCGNNTSKINDGYFKNLFCKYGIPIHLIIQGGRKNDHTHATVDIATQFACMFGILPNLTFAGAELFVIKDISGFFFSNLVYIVFQLLNF